MANYSATQQYTRPTEHTEGGGFRMEAGAVIYRITDSLRELAQEIEKVQGMKSCRDYVFDPLITVYMGKRDPRECGDYELRDGRLHKVPAHV